MVNGIIFNLQWNKVWMRMNRRKWSNTDGYSERSWARRRQRVDGEKCGGGKQGQWRKGRKLINFIKSIGVDNARGTRSDFKVASYLAVVALFCSIWDDTCMWKMHMEWLEVYRNVELIKHFNPIFLLLLTFLFFFHSTIHRMGIRLL